MSRLMSRFPMAGVPDLLFWAVPSVEGLRPLTSSTPWGGCTATAVTSSTSSARRPAGCSSDLP